MSCTCVKLMLYSRYKSCKCVKHLYIYIKPKHDHCIPFAYSLLVFLTRRLCSFIDLVKTALTFKSIHIHTNSVVTVDPVVSF